MPKPYIQGPIDEISRKLQDLENKLRRPDVQLGHRSVFTMTSAGEVPAPGGPYQGRFLREDGTWHVVTGSGGGGGGDFSAAYSSLQTGITASIGSAYSSLQTGVTSSVVSAYNSLRAGVTASVVSAYNSLSTGVTASITALSSAFEARIAQGVPIDTPTPGATPGQVFFAGTTPHITQSADLFWHEASSSLGVGTTSPGSRVHIVDDVMPLIAERFTVGTTGIVGAARVKARTNGNMTDGFGAYITWQIRDNAGADNTIGGIAAVRAGADNTGDIIIAPATVGAPTERMRIMAAGAVGIGTPSPGVRFEVQDNSTTHVVRIRNTNALGYSALNFLADDGVHGLGVGYSNSENLSYFSYTDDLKLATPGNIQRQKWFNGGQFNIGPATSAPNALFRVQGTTEINPIGTTTPTFEAGITASLIVAQGGGNWGVAVIRATADGAGPHFTLAKTRATDPGTRTAVQNGDNIGNLNWQAVDSVGTMVRTAAMYAVVAGSVGSSVIPTDIVFAVNTGSITGGSERLRISHNGTVKATADLIVSGSITGSQVLSDTDFYVRGNPLSGTIDARIKSLSGSIGSAIESTYASLSAGVSGSDFGLITLRYPSSAAETNELIGYGQWTAGNAAGWHFEENTGSLSTAYGTGNFTVLLGHPSYRQDGVRGASDAGVGIKAVSLFAGGGTGNFDAGSTSDVAFAIVVAQTGTEGGSCFPFQKGSIPGAGWGVSMGPSPTKSVAFFVSGTAGIAIATTADRPAAPFVIVGGYSRATNQIAVGVRSLESGNEFIATSAQAAGDASVSQALRMHAGITGSAAVLAASFLAVGSGSALALPENIGPAVRNFAAGVNRIQGTAYSQISGTFGSVYSSLQSGVTASIASLSGTVNARFVDLSGTINARFATIGSGAGSLLNVQKFTSNGTYTPTPGTTKIIFEMVGGGGGSGATWIASGTHGATGGGASGVYLRHYMTLTSSTGSVVIGAAGAGGRVVSAGPLNGAQRIAMNGQTGGDTVFFVNNTSYLARGGGGTSGSIGSAVMFAQLGTGGLVRSGSTAADVVVAEPGDYGIMGTTVPGGTSWAGPGGSGGSSPLGAGGERSNIVGADVASNGRHATGYGSGGGGSAVYYAGYGTQWYAWGASGSQGVVIIHEYA